MADLKALLHDRYGFDADALAELTPTMQTILAHRSCRAYTERDIDDGLLNLLIACAQSAPAKSNLQQYSIVVVRDPARRRRIGELVPDLAPWFDTAPVFLCFLGDVRRIRRLAGLRGRDYRNDNADTFMNACVDAALVTFATAEVDLIITDLVMPERDGFDLIKAIRGGTKAPGTPIIVASASAFAGDQVRAMAIGANEFMPKPVDSALLLQKMAALLKIEYDSGDKQAPDEAAAPSVQTLAGELGTPQARIVIDGIREAAELGQMRRVEALIDAVSDGAMSRALRTLLEPALREQDSELVLQPLDKMAGKA